MGPLEDKDCDSQREEYDFDGVYMEMFRKEKV